MHPTTLVAVTVIAPTGDAARRSLPIGARYPRTWPVADGNASLAPTTTAAAATGRMGIVFPTGCRFPRRSAADIEAYLAAASPAVPHPPRLRESPVGARFPRRVRPAADRPSAGSASALPLAA